MPQADRGRRAVFFDVENASRAVHVAAALDALGLPDGQSTRVAAIGNWCVVSVEAAHLLARAGAELIHSAPVAGVKDWTDLRIAVEAGRWLGAACPGDRIDIVSNDQAFDAVGDVAACHGIAFRRLSLREVAEAAGAPAAAPRRRAPARRRGRRRA